MAGWESAADLVSSDFDAEVAGIQPPFLRSELEAGSRRGNRHTMTASDLRRDRELAELYLSGLPAREAGRWLGVSDSIVYGALKRLNIPRRRRGAQLGGKVSV